MAYKLVIDPGAEKELEEVLEWYIERDEALAVTFIEKYDEALKQISHNPQQFQKRYGKTRIVFLDPYPYGVHYIINADLIYVIAVFHTSRHPRT